jgi:hypothetical protein
MSRRVSQGVVAPGAPHILGTVPALIQGSSDMNALCSVKFGASVMGDKVFVSINAFDSGWESVPVTFRAVVPAA